MIWKLSLCVLEVAITWICVCKWETFSDALTDFVFTFSFALNKLPLYPIESKQCTHMSLSCCMLQYITSTGYYFSSATISWATLMPENHFLVRGSAPTLDHAFLQLSWDNVLSNESSGTNSDTVSPPPNTIRPTIHGEILEEFIPAIRMAVSVYNFFQNMVLKVP